MNKDINHNKIALTIDVEDWYHTPAVTGSNFSFYKDVHEFMKHWNKRYDYLTEPTKRVLRILKEYNIKATFFIVANVVDYYNGLVELIARDGHEISCHGLHHAIKIDSKTKKPRFSLSQFEDRTNKAREVLQKVTGQRVDGYRAPGGYIAKWMYNSLIDLGFRYDSSINSNSFFNKSDFDLKRISSKPYSINGMNSSGKIIELPFSYLQVGGFRFPTSGGPFLRFFPAQYILMGLNDSLTRGNTVFYLHPIDVSNKTIPSLASKNSNRPFYFITSGRKTEEKLSIIIKKFRNKWTTCNQLLELQ